MTLAYRTAHQQSAELVTSAIKDRYTRDSKPNADFSLPGSILLRRTAEEVLREIDNYTEAYLYYLCRTYLLLAIGRDPTFGLKLSDLGDALAARAEICEDSTARNACINLARQIKETV